MGDLNQEIETAFKATSLILVFITVLFGLRYPQIRRDIRAEIPARDRAKRRHREKLCQSLLVNCLPLLLINGAASYLFLPLFTRVLIQSCFELWNFDFSRTSFVGIALMVFVFFLWSGYLAIQLIRRTYKSR